MQFVFFTTLSAVIVLVWSKICHSCSSITVSLIHIHLSSVSHFAHPFLSLKEVFTFQSGSAQNSIVKLCDTLKTRRIYICFNVLLVWLEITTAVFFPVGGTCCCKHHGGQYPELSFSRTEDGTASFSSL